MYESIFISFYNLLRKGWTKTNAYACVYMLGFDMFDKYSHGGCSCFGSTFSQKVAQKVG